MTWGQSAVARATAAVFVAGQRVGSAVLVDPRHLVTALHVLFRLDPDTLARVQVEQVELEFPHVRRDGQSGRVAASRLDLGRDQFSGGRGCAGPRREPARAGCLHRCRCGRGAATKQGKGVRLPAGRGTSQRGVAAVHGSGPGRCRDGAAGLDRRCWHLPGPQRRADHRRRRPRSGRDPGGRVPTGAVRPVPAGHADRAGVAAVAPTLADDWDRSERTQPLHSSSARAA